MDFKVNNKLDVIFNVNHKNDLTLIDTMEEEKQKLFVYCSIYKGALPYDLNWGFDYQHLIRISRLNDIEIVRSFFIQILNMLKISVPSVLVRFDKNLKLLVEFPFPRESLVLEYKV